MIRNESEYQEAVNRLMDEEKRLKAHEEKLHEEGYNSEEMKRLMDPLQSFHLQLKEEIECYEQLKQGNIGEIRRFEDIGRGLIALRIARGLSQRDLAAELGINESQISRDERNEYRNISVERADRILKALKGNALIQFMLRESTDFNPIVNEDR